MNYLQRTTKRRKGYLWGLALGWGMLFQAQAAAEYTIKTVVGTGEANCNDASKVHTPQAVVLDKPNSRLYIFELEAHTIRYLDINTGSVVPYAGTCGTAGFSPDATLATSATLNAPSNGVIYNGELYFTEEGNHRVRKIDSAGTIQTVAGDGTVGFGGDGGPATSAQLTTPSALEINEGLQQLYIVDAGAHCIRLVDLTSGNTTSGIIQTFMGTCGTSGNQRPPAGIQFNSPRGLIFDGDGNLLIADTLNREILKVHDGEISVYYPRGELPPISLVKPVGLASENSELYVADPGANQIYVIHPPENNPSVEVIAGTGEAGYSGDGGNALSTQLNAPQDVENGLKTGEVYIADTLNHRIRMLDPKPVAKIKLESAFGTTPLKVKLSSESTDLNDNITQYAWLASDGQSLNTQTAEFTFAKPDKYTVRLTVTDASNGSSAEEIEVKLMSLTVDAKLGIIPFTVKASVKDLLVPEGDTITYAWQTYDKTKPEEVTLYSNKNSNTEEFLFQHAGEYCITVTATNQNGDFSKAEECITARINRKPVPSLTVDEKVVLPSKTVHASAQGSFDPDGDTFTYAWATYDKNNPGVITSYPDKTGETENFDFEPGEWCIRVVVTDQWGASDKLDKCATIRDNTAPVVSLTVAPPLGIIPLTVQASAKGTHDLEGDSFTYAWTTYDGDKPNEIISSNKTGEEESFDFNTRGNYCIRVTATDQWGASDKLDKCVKVEDQDMAAKLSLKSPTNAFTCKDFEVTLQLTPPANFPADFISAYVNFDATILEVMSLTPITNNAYFEMMTDNFDNTSGQIDLMLYALTPDVPKETIDLVTVTFHAKGEIPNTSLEFSTTESRKTEVLSEGFSVLGKKDDSTFPVQNVTLLSGQANLVQAYKGTPQLMKITPMQNAALRIWKTPPIPEALFYLNDQLPKTDATGSFAISGLPMGTFDFYVAGINTLQTKQSVTLGENCAETAQLNLEFIGGDVAGKDKRPPDNRVDGYDFSVFTTYKNDTSENKTAFITKFALTDFNLDGSADAKDTDLAFLNRLFDLNYDGSVNDDDAKVIRGGTDLEPNIGKAGQNKPTGPYLRHGARRSAEERMVTVQLQVAETQPVDVGEVHLTFDPTLLQVTSLESSAYFDTPLQSTFDNETGHIDFLVGQLAEAKPKGQIDLVTIHFTVLGEGGEESLAIANAAAISEGLTLTEVITTTLTEADLAPPLLASTQCQLYGVQDEQVNDSQLFTIHPLTAQISNVGTECSGCDIKALAVHPLTNILYGASGHEASNDRPAGHLYQVAAQSGEWLAIGNSGFAAITSLAFTPDGTLWGWAKGQGLVQFDLTTGAGTLLWNSDAPVGNLVGSLDGSILYGLIGTNLYAYEVVTGNIEVACDNLPQATETLEVLSDGALLLGVREADSLSLHAFATTTCQMLANRELATAPDQTVQGLVLPKAACE